MKKKFFIIFFYLFFSYISLISIEPDVFVQSTVNRASKFYQKIFQKKKKLNNLKIIAKDTVDIKE